MKVYKPRGTAGMKPEVVAKVSSIGGKALMEKRGKEYLMELARRGGLKISANREHMAAIGRKGGAASKKKASPPDDESIDLCQKIADDESHQDK